MKTTDRLLARRYARALLDAAGKPEARARVSTDFGHAKKLLRDHHAHLRHPLVPVSEKSALLERVFGKQVSEETRRFIELLVQRKRYSLLTLISVELEALSDEDAGIARAHVRSAGPLTDKERTELSQRLGRFLDKKVVLDVKDDKSLIGGVVVRVGDWVLDTSIVRHLQRIKESVVKAQ